MATTISSVFNIVVELAAGTGTTNIATKRSFRVTGLLGTGADNATLTLSKVNAAGDVVTQIGVVTMQNAAGGGVDSLVDQAGALDVIANRKVLETDTLRLVRAAANSTRLVIQCEAFDPGTLVES
tara:strand:+ start:190 stop:564 length:375 start_codon:yes stop_codon:yes gene_type:complete